MMKLRVGVLLLACGFAVGGASAQPVAFVSEPGKVAINIGGKPFATYVYKDAKVLRPFFCNVHEPGGLQVTRNHPPVEGKDSKDHGDMHPGIWLAFGDISGADFWRNKGTVRHEKFIEEPKGGDGSGMFAVSNAYESDGKVICREVGRYTILARPEGYYVMSDSRFSSDAPFAFGDQEEMGFGVRLATPLIVKGGSGAILNSDGLKNEAGAWGKQADWCDYSGTLEGRKVGVALLTHPENFRRSWFHVRDYGLALANPFGNNAFTEGEKSRIEVAPGKELRLRFAAFVHGDVDPAAAYKTYAGLEK